MAGFDFTALLDTALAAGTGIKKGQREKKDRDTAKKRDALAASLARDRASRDRTRVKQSGRRVTLAEEEAERQRAELARSETERDLRSEFVLSQLSPEDQQRLRTAGLTSEQIILEGGALLEAAQRRDSQQFQSNLIKDRSVAREGRAADAEVTETSGRKTEAEILDLISKRALALLGQAGATADEATIAEAMQAAEAQIRAAYAAPKPGLGTVLQLPEQGPQPFDVDLSGTAPDQDISQLPLEQLEAIKRTRDNLLMAGVPESEALQQAKAQVLGG